MFKHTAALAILGASLLTSGCSDTDALVTATGPTSPQFVGSAFASIRPSLLSAQFVGEAACPEVQPLHVRANLTVFADEVSFLLTEVRMQFFDTFGITAPQITLPAPVLTREFGTALVLARSARTFPLDFRFGCGTHRIGTLVVLVRGRHGDGRDDSTEIRVGVR